MAILTRGGPIKHDLANARYWAKQALANPPKGVRPVDVQVAVGQLLSESDHVEERQRGIDLLEPLAKAGRGNAQAYLAVAIRNADPVRARQLLESARGTYPGAALAPLSDMLIKGEGGPKNERRALSLLKGSAYDAQHAKWALGQLTLEGRLVPRDVAAAVKLLGPGRSGIMIRACKSFGCWRKILTFKWRTLTILFIGRSRMPSWRARCDGRADRAQVIASRAICR